MCFITFIIVIENRFAERRGRNDVSEMGRLFLGRRQLRKCVRPSQPASQGLAPENQLLDPYINLMGEARAVASRCAHAFSSPLSFPLPPSLSLSLSHSSSSQHTYTRAHLDVPSRVQPTLTPYTADRFSPRCARDRPRDVARNVDFSTDLGSNPSLSFLHRAPTRMTALPLPR